MQWSTGPNAGFSVGSAAHPWLPIGPEWERLNVEAESADPYSTLNLYRRLLEIRHGSSALRRGSYLTHPASTSDLLVYRRESDDETMTVALNFGEEEALVALGACTVVFSTDDPERSDRSDGAIRLAPFEGVVVSHG